MFNGTKTELAKAISDNDGYCPCKFEKNDNTKCPCLEYRTTGECECGMFKSKTAFKKVSFEQFQNDTESSIQSTVISYDNILLPRRGTDSSCGYDFFMPYSISMEPGKTYKIYSGIRAIIPDGMFLMIVPRSSLGFKYGMRLNNTVGIIDSDYYKALNEGHIIISLSVDKECTINTGERFCQGIFLPYNTTFDDEPISSVRIGGIGSTGK